MEAAGSGGSVQRIFLGLAALAMALLVVNLFLGLGTGDYNTPVHAYVSAARQLDELKRAKAPLEEIEAAEQKREALFQQVKQVQPGVIRHMLVGILGALVTLLVCSVSITYFIGTSRWLKEVVETYKLDRAYVTDSARIKRRSFRWSVAGALAILAVVLLGGAAEPTLANAPSAASFVAPHYVAGLLSIAFLAVSFIMQGVSLAENGQLVERVMGDVRRIRAERGLAVEPSIQ